MTKNLKELFVRNTLFSITQQAITTATTFILMPYMIWRMGAEGYGFWMMLQIFSVVGYLSLAEMGFQGSIVRYMTKFLAEKNINAFKDLYSSGFVLFAAIGVVCCVGLMLFNKYFFLKIFPISPDRASEMQASLTVYSISFLFQFPVMILKAFYISIQDFFKLKLWESMNVIVFALLVFTVMFFRSNVLTVVVLETAVHFFFFIVFLVLPFKHYKGLYSFNIKRFSMSSLKDISEMTSYLFFYKIFGLIFNRTPQIFIAYFLTPTYMTYYAIISKIPRTLKLVQGMINSAVLPLAVSLDTLQYQDKMKQLFLRGTRYSFLFSTPVLVFTMLFTEDILKLWIGEDYIFLAAYLRVYVFWQYINFLISFGQSMYTRTDHFKSMLPYYVLGTGSLLLFMFFYIERLELWAILYGLILSSIVVIPSNMVIIRKINKFSLHEFFIIVLKSPVILGALFCIILLFLIRAYLAVDNIMVLIMYAFVMYTFYLYVFYKYCLFDFERNDISLMLKKIQAS